MEAGKFLERLSFLSKHSYQASASGIELPVTISVAVDREVSLLAKVDTGATYCIFQREYAEALGLTVEDGLPKRISTATRTFSAFGHNVNLSCFDYEFESTVYFAGQYEFPRNVLGLEGWLDKMRFGLVHYDRLLFLSRYDE